MEITELISRCLKKEKAAEKQLYLTYAPYIFGISRRYSKDDAQAEDYMQEGFDKIFRNLEKFDSDKGNFKSWISRVTVNCIISLKRKEKIDYVYDTDKRLANVPEETDEILERDIDSETLLLAIRKLPEIYQTTLNMYVFEELSHKEISENMHVAESSVRSRFTRAKKLLKNILAEKISIPT